MITFFSKTLELIMPRCDDEGSDINSDLITDCVHTLINMTDRCSITETEGYYNFSTAISYKYKYRPVVTRGQSDQIIHALYSFIATLLLYHELDVVNINVDDEMFEFNIDDLEKLKFTLNKILFHEVREF